MIHLSRLITVALSASALGLVIAGCQPQGETPAAEVAAAAEDITAGAEVLSTAKSSQLMGAAEISELLAGTTVIGVLESANVTWAQFFSPDGATKSISKSDGQALELSGTYYSNDQDQLCIEFPEAPWEPKVLCFNLLPLGDGKYQQVIADGAKMGVYTKIIEGEHLDALE